MTHVDNSTPPRLHAPAPHCPNPIVTEPTVTEIRPAESWQLINVRELWQFRDLLYFLAWRDVQLRYKQTVLGAAWAVLQPVLLMIVFTIFFNRSGASPSASVPYPLFTYAGLLPWLFFSTALASASSSVIGSEKLITKIYFPRLAIPFAAVGAALVDFLVAFGLLVLIMLCLQFWPTWHIVLLPAVIGLVFVAAIGVGTLLAALNVKYRDIRYVVPFLLQVWMFATPSIYMDVADLNAGGLLRALVVANPLTGLVAAFRACLLGTPMPWDLLASAALLSSGAFVLGCFYFRRMEDGFADVI
jgi:lipopolysaccharide transport system permease protein